MKYGAIEAGGTKFVCAIFDDELKVIERTVIDTTTPKDTMDEVYKFFDNKEISSFGIGSFGPIGIDKNLKDYGYINKTPKLPWVNFNFLQAMKDRYGVPIGWTNDVIAACLGEYVLGNAKNKNTALYLTIGTGVGGGLIKNGEMYTNWSTPETGHIFLKKREDDNFEGICPYHGDCFEGMVSGPAIEKRAGVKAQNIKPDDEIWDLIAYYIAQALWTYTVTMVPDVIILGGGVMNQKHLFPLIKNKFKEIANDYIDYPNIDDYIKEPLLDGEQGILGCGILAKMELEGNN